MADPMMPDLTGLSEEERKIIEEVLSRQRAEEQKEEQISQAANKDLDEIERQIAQRKETALRLVGTQDDAICQICQKTKFADGIGHKCFYCQLRSCARCGGRTTSKNKNIWACSLCQKRQQILARTGKWFQNPADAGAKTPSMEPGSADASTQDLQQLSNGSIPNGTGPPQAQSVSPQHPQPQTQPQPQPPQQLQHQHQQPPLQQQQQQQQSQPQSMVGGLMGMIGLKSPLGGGTQPQQQQQQPPPFQQQQQNPQMMPSSHRGPQGMAPGQQMPQQPSQHIPPQNGRHGGGGPGMGPRKQSTLHRQPSLESAEYSNSNGTSQHGRVQHREQPETSRRTTMAMEDGMHSQEPPRRRKISSMEPPATDAGFIESPRNDYYYDESATAAVGGGGGRKRSTTARPNQQIYDDDPSFRSRGAAGRTADERPPHVDRRPPNGKLSTTRAPRGLVGGETGASGRQGAAGATQGSGGMPPAVPPPEKPIGFSTPTTLKPLPSMQSRHRKNRFTQNRSVSLRENGPGGGSSTDEETPQGNTEAEKNDFTEKDLLLYIYGGHRKMGPEMAKFDASLKSKSNLDLATSARSSVLPGNSLAAKIKNYLMSPVSWHPSADQKFLIGHMVLQRLPTDNGDLGLKVSGGRQALSPRAGAYITKVRPGSVADIVGQLRPGDQVLEWNNHSLLNASPETVKAVVTASKNDTSVDLIVSRPLASIGADDFLNLRRNTSPYNHTFNDMYTTAAAAAAAATAAAATSGQGDLVGMLSPHHLAAAAAYGGPVPVTVTSPFRNSRHASIGPVPRQKWSAPEMPFSLSQELATAPRRHSPLAMTAATNAAVQAMNAITGASSARAGMSSKAQIFGRIEIALLYVPDQRELIVTVLGAFDLPPRRDGALRNPFAKLFLLPDRSEKSCRQTTVLAETLSPMWNESFYYRNVAEPLLMNRVLEVTVWDYDQYDANAFLGEVLVDFSMAVLDNQAFSYTLVEMDDDNPLRLRLRGRKFSSLTPPPRPYSELANYASGRPGGPAYGYRRPVMDPYRPQPVQQRYEDEYDSTGMEGGYGYGQGPATGIGRAGASQPGLPRSYTDDRSVGIHAGGMPGPSCVCGGMSDWNINSAQPQTNGYVLNDMSTKFFSKRPHSATAIRRDEDYYGATGSTQPGPPPAPHHGHRYRTRSKVSHHHHHQQQQQLPQQQQQQRYDNPPSGGHKQGIYGNNPMSPLTSPPNGNPPGPGDPAQYYGPPGERYDPVAGDFEQPAPNGYGYHDERERERERERQPRHSRQQPGLPPHMQSQGEYGSDGSETMSVNSAQSIQNRMNMRQHAVPMSSEEGDQGSSSSLRQQHFAADDYNQSQSIEDATQSDTATKGGSGGGATNAAALKEMKERKKSLMTRLINRGPGGPMEHKRTGFARSEEVGVPEALSMSQDRYAGFQKQPSKDSTDSDNWPQSSQLATDHQLGTFIENLGPGQVVGRQVLASPVLGEIELRIGLGQFGVSVTILRARNLQTQTAVKNFPAPYVKVYLMEGKQCVCKAKTTPTTKTTSPNFGQQIEFNESFKHKALQLTVLGDAGRMERKIFIGVAQVKLDELATLPQPVQGWYKLFNHNSLTGVAPLRKDSETSLFDGGGGVGQQQPQQFA